MDAVRPLPVETPLVVRCEGEELVGILHPAGRDVRSVGVVVVVGGPQYRVGSHRQFVLMARAFAAAGYPVLRFDYRGMGDSAAAVRSFDDVEADVRAAVDALLEAVPSLRGVVLWGLCDAASAVLMYCAADPRVTGVVIANPWVRTVTGEARSYLKHYYLQRLLQRPFWRKVFTGGFSVGRSARDLTTAVRQASAGSPRVGPSPAFIDGMLAGLRRFERPVQVLLSERDLVAQEFADRCKADSGWRHTIGRRNVEVLDLAGADHTFSTRAALERAVAASLDWLGRLEPRSTG